MDGSADDISDWRARISRSMRETREQADGVVRFHRDVGRIARSVEKIAATMAQKAVDEPVTPPAYEPAPIKVWRGRDHSGNAMMVTIVDLGDSIVGSDDKGNHFEAFTDLVRIDPERVGYGTPWIQVTTDKAAIAAQGGYVRAHNIIGAFEDNVDWRTLRDSADNPFLSTF